MLFRSLVGTLEVVTEEGGTTEATSIATDTATALAQRLLQLRQQRRFSIPRRGLDDGRRNRQCPGYPLAESASQYEPG